MPRWQTTRAADVPCAGCGKKCSCTVSPDGTAFKCWRDGGRIIQTGPLPSRTSDTPSGTSWKPTPTRRQMKKADDKPSAPKDRKTYPDAQAAIAAAGWILVKEGATHAATWTYRRKDGTDHACVARFDLPDGSKEFRPVHRARGGWKVGDPPGLWPLYRLSELDPASDAIVYVAEGEKCADAARSIGLNCTTSAHGAAAAEKTDWTPLAGREVPILVDADGPGRKYGLDVARILVELDPPARPKIVELKGLGEGEDVADFIAARPDDHAESIAAEIELQAFETPCVDPLDLIGGPVLVCAADVEPQAIKWLWERRMALGRITVLSGVPGEGKSFFTIDASARVSTGSPWPDGAECPRGSVLLICGEDDPADTIIPRLKAHHADMSRVHLLSMVRRVGDDGENRETMFTLQDCAALEAALRKLPDVRLIVVDPIGSFLGARIDANKDNEVRSVLAPVAALAAKYGAAVLVVAHRRKGAGGGGGADESTLGSRAFTGIARAVWHLCHDKDDPSRKLLLAGKNNLSAPGHGLAFRLTGEPIASVSWEREPVTITADEALAAEVPPKGKPGPPAVKLGEAMEWLQQKLSAGPIRVGNPKNPAPGTLRYLAPLAGYSWTTIERAARELKIDKPRDGFGRGGVHQWSLPDTPQSQAREAGEEAVVTPTSSNPLWLVAHSVDELLPADESL